MKRLILLVGLSDLDDETFVIGAWEEGILDVLGQEDVDRLFSDLKAQWYPDGQEWREIVVEIPGDALLAAFQKPPAIQGTVA